MLPSREFSSHSAIPVKAEESLAVAFASFTEAAGSLEKSYAQLQREVMRLRGQLEQTNRELERERETARRAQALAEVATVLAHEIRNPLASLELFAGLLAESPELGEDNQRIVGHVQAGLRTLAATVNNVLQFHSKPPQDLVPTNLANLVRMTLEFLSPLATQSGVELEFEDELGDVCVGADPHSLQQVLLNLAMNAIRFMPNGGTLKVAGSMRKGSGSRSAPSPEGEGCGTSTNAPSPEKKFGIQAELRISDTGPGIAPENRAHIFEPGFTTRPGSPGLGLPVCKKIMEQHGGRIELAEAAPGATFVLKFRAIESRA